MEAELQPQQHEKEMIRHGRALIVNLFVLLKTAQNYNAGHSALSVPVNNMLAVVREVQRKNEEAAIRTRGGYAFLGELRIKPDAGGVDATLFIMDLMKRYGVGGIVFTPAVTPQEIMQLAYILKEVEAGPIPHEVYERVVDAIHAKGIANIDAEPYTEEGEYERTPEPLPADSKARAKKVYLQTISSISEVMDNARMGQTLRLRKSKRVVQTMIDQLLAAETNLLGLTTIRCHDEYTYTHSVNVCILSLSIGQRIGFSKPKLFELGMAALFHDIGKSDIPGDILNKPEEFSPEEWRVIHQHPILGVRKLMKLKGLDVLTSRIVTGAYEHHLNCDLSGYPNFPYPKISFFGRIISIADCYDALTSSRVYNRVPFPPDRALRFMLDKTPKVYDPLLMKLFVNCIGIYPLGTLVRLSTRELAVVVANNPDTAFAEQPSVKLISNQQGEEADGRVVDLSLGETRIVHTLDPNRYRLDPSLYFL